MGSLHPLYLVGIGGACIPQLGQNSVSRAEGIQAADELNVNFVEITKKGDLLWRTLFHRVVNKTIKAKNQHRLNRIAKHDLKQKKIMRPLY